MSFPHEGWGALMLTQFWQVSAVALAAGLLVRCCARRRPHLAHVLWLLVIVKCLTPPLWSSPTGVFSWAAVRNLAAAPVAPLADNAAPTPAVAAPLAGPPADVAPETAAQPMNAAPAAPVAPASTWNAPPFWACLWLSGALAFAGYGLVRGLFWARRLHSTRAAHDDALPQLVAVLAQRFGVRRRVRVEVTHAPLGPALLGLWRPVILLPETLVRNASLPQLEPIVAHELIHVRRRDVAIGWLQCAAQIAWWFHPLVWWANRGLCQARELCCDEEVLAPATIAPAAYAQSLLDVLRLRQAQTLWAAPGVRRVEVTKQRLEDIMVRSARYCARTPRWQWALLVIAALLILPSRGLVFQGNAAAPAAEPQTNSAAPAAPLTLVNVPQLEGTPVSFAKALAEIEAREQKIKALRWHARFVSVVRLKDGDDSRSVVKTEPGDQEHQVVFDPHGRRYNVQKQVLAQWINGAAPYIAEVSAYSFDGTTYRAWHRSKPGRQFPTAADPTRGAVSRNRSDIGWPNRETDLVAYALGTAYMPPYSCVGHWDNVASPQLLSHSLRRWRQEQRDISIVADAQGVWTISAIVHATFGDGSGDPAKQIRTRNLLRLRYDPTKGGVVTGAIWYPVDPQGRMVQKNGRDLTQQRLEVDLQMVNDGWWAPKTVRLLMAMDRLMYVYAFDHIEINPPLADDAFALRFPGGTNVRDETRQTTYTVNRSAEEEKAEQSHMQRTPDIPPPVAETAPDKTSPANAAPPPAPKTPTKKTTTQPPAAARAALAVRVVDEAGQPVPNALVGDFAVFDDRKAVTGQDDGDGWQYGDHVVTDKDGRATLECDNDIAMQCLFARHAARQLVGIQAVPRDKPAAPLTLTLHPQCKLAGKVTAPALTARKRPITWSNVYLYAGDHRVLSCMSAHADYHFFLPPGLYRLWAYGTEVGSARKTVNIKPGQTELTVDIETPARKLVLLEGQPAPELHDIVAWKNSEPLKLADLRGKVVVLEFWGHSCGPCVGGMPSLFTLYDKYREQGLAVVAIHVDDEVDTVAKLDEKLARVKKTIWRDRDLPFPVALLLQKKSATGKTLPDLTRDYGIEHYPTSVLIDRKGNVVQEFEARSMKEWQFVEEALAQE